jgi:hypothetical protein
MDSVARWRLLNRLVGLVVGAYALFTTWGFITLVMIRNGVTPPFLPDPEVMGGFLPVLLSVPAWALGIWALAAVLYIVAAVRLIPTGLGASWYTAALFCDLSFLLVIKIAGAIHADPERVDLDYMTATFTVTLCVVLWIGEWMISRATDPDFD